MKELQFKVTAAVDGKLLFRRMTAARLKEALTLALAQVGVSGTVEEVDTDECPVCHRAKEACKC